MVWSTWTFLSLPSTAIQAMVSHGVLWYGMEYTDLPELALHSHPGKGAPPRLAVLRGLGQLPLLLHVHLHAVQLSHHPTIQSSNYPTIQLYNYPTIQLTTLSNQLAMKPSDQHCSPRCTCPAAPGGRISAAGSRTSSAPRPQGSGDPGNPVH